MNGRRSDKAIGRYGGYVFFALSLVAVIFMGFFHNKGESLWNHDSSFWYVAGKSWIQGHSPYDHRFFLAQWQEAVGGQPLGVDRSFVYPPTMSVIAVPMAMLPWAVAAPLFRAVSFVAYLSIGYLLTLMLRSSIGKEPRQGEPWVYFGVCGFIYPVGQTLHQGQISLIVMWGITVAFYGLLERKSAWIIVGTVFACIKPQMAFLPLLFIALRGGLKPLLLGVCVASAAAIGVLARTYSSTLLSEYTHSMSVHLALKENSAFFYDSVPSLLGMTALSEAALYVGVFGAVTLTVWIATTQRWMGREGELRAFQLVLAAVAAFLPLHRYDMVVYVPLVTSLVLLRQPWQRWGIVAVVVVHGQMWRAVRVVLDAGAGLWEQLTLGTLGASFLAGVIFVALASFWWQDCFRRRAIG